MGRIDELSDFEMISFALFDRFQSVFCRIINAFPCVLKYVDIIFLVLNQLELTNSVNCRMLCLPYDSLKNV